MDGMIARAENQAMVGALEIPVEPVERVPFGCGEAVVMVDSQPHTGRRTSEAAVPVAVLDHHETGGNLEGVRYLNLRPNLGATSTIVTGYLLEQEVPIGTRLATALLYGIESETLGYPREAAPSDDGALIWLFPRADKDLLARIRNPKLPQSYFATYQHALNNAFLYRDLVICRCGDVPQPDIVAELADFLIRFEAVNWALSAGKFENLLKLSLRCARIGDHGGELLRGRQRLGDCGRSRQTRRRRDPAQGRRSGDGRTRARRSSPKTFRPPRDRQPRRPAAGPRRAKRTRSLKERRSAVNSASSRRSDATRD